MTKWSLYPRRRTYVVGTDENLSGAILPIPYGPLVYLPLNIAHEAFQSSTETSRQAGKISALNKDMV